MKRLPIILFFAVIICASSSFVFKINHAKNEIATVEESYYGYITIDGVFWDNHRAFVSKTIYYPG